MILLFISYSFCTLLKQTNMEPKPSCPAYSKHRFLRVRRERWTANDFNTLLSRIPGWSERALYCNRLADTKESEDCFESNARPSVEEEFSSRTVSATLLCRCGNHERLKPALKEAPGSTSTAPRRVLRAPKPGICLKCGLKHVTEACQMDLTTLQCLTCHEFGHGSGICPRRRF